jgi:predicted RNA-binding Zn-ribbon protein involved in translation (DUF1610 family)
MKIKCISCNHPIEFYSCHSQPFGGTEFIGGGVYGSRITDDQHKYAIYLCDNCAETLIKTKSDLISVFTEEKSTKYKRRFIEKDIL